MRVTLTFDSVYEVDLRALLRVWHDTRAMGIPPSIIDTPTIGLDGMAYKVTLPALWPARAEMILRLLEGSAND